MMAGGHLHGDGCLHGRLRHYMLQSNWCMIHSEQRHCTSSAYFLIRFSMICLVACRSLDTYMYGSVLVRSSYRYWCMV